MHFVFSLSFAFARGVQIACRGLPCFNSIIQSMKGCFCTQNHDPFSFCYFTFSLKINGKSFFSFIFSIFFKKSNSKNKLITCKANNSTECNIAEVRCKSGFPINQAEDDREKDCEVLPELAILLEHEEKRFSCTKNS